jgi:hypothetical protein
MQDENCSPIGDGLCKAQRLLFTGAAARHARTKLRRVRAKFLLAILIACAGPVPAAAEQSFTSVSLQNDVLFGRDGGGYTNGIFVSKLRVASAEESGIEPPLLLKPIFAWLGMPRSTLASSTLSQAMITPRDLERHDPDPQDVPYVGMLVFRSTHVFVHDDTADMLALNLGVTGPASGAAQTQRFAHRLFNGTEPEGWDSQDGNKALLSVEGYRGWQRPFGASGQANGDFVALAGGTLGNRDASVGGAVLLRYGTGLERSFPTLMRVTGRSGDPLAIDRGWFAYAGLSADRLFRQAGLGDDAPSGNTAPLSKFLIIAVAGIAYGWDRSSLSFSLQSASPLVESVNHRQSYGSITYTWRLP